MPDPRSVMKEFRSLEQRRAAGGLTPAEEARWTELRDLVAPEPSPRRGFDVDAAAAQLRESLLPAGLRNRTGAAAASVAPEPDLADALSAALPGAPLDAPPAPDASLDPSPLPEAPAAGWDPSAAWDPNAQPYDPGAALDPNAPPYDASQAYDPNAQPAWDPDAKPYDPDAAAYDPNAPPYDASRAYAYDPHAQAAWDPNAPAFDPNAQPFDPNAPAYDASQPYDPNAAALDANAQPFDPNAQPYDPNAQPYDPSAQPYNPNAQPYDPNAPGYDPGAQPWDAAQPQGEAASAAWDGAATYDADAPVAHDALAYDPTASPEAGVQPYPPAEPAAPTDGDYLGEPASAAGASVSEPEGLPPEGWAAPDAGLAPAGEAGAAAGEDAGLESLLPFDAAAAAAISPGEVPAGFGRELGEYDETAGFRRGGGYADAAPADLPGEEPGFQAAQSVEAEAAEGWQPDAALDDGFQLESGGSFDATADAAAPEWAGGTAPPPWEPPGGAASGVAAEPAPPVEDAALAEPQPLSADDFVVDVEAPPDAPEAAPDEEAAFVDAAIARADAAPGAPEAGVASVEAGAAAMHAEPEAAPAPEIAAEAAPAGAPAPDDDGIPTIDGEEILEEVAPEELELVGGPGEPVAAAAATEPELAPPAPEPAAAVVPAAPPAAAIPAPPVEALAPVPAPMAASAAPGEWYLPGAHRVVVHTVEGQVRRGVLEDVDLGAEALALFTQPDAPPEDVLSDKVKAIFFMLAPGEAPPVAEGKKVRVTFRDGRQVAGFSPDYRDTGIGFFMIPVDTRTNTGRIWVYRSAVRQVSVS
jgi:hypothetical protein